MMKRLKTMLAVIKPADPFLARHDDGNGTPPDSEGVGGDTCGTRRTFARDLTGGFTAAWIMLAVCIAAMIALTFAFSPRSYARWLGTR
jgi:hypothetical protein